MLQFGDKVQVSDFEFDGWKWEYRFEGYDKVPTYKPSKNHGRIGHIVTSYSPLYQREMAEVVVHSKVTVQFEDEQGNIETIKIDPRQLEVIQKFEDSEFYVA